VSKSNHARASRGAAGTCRKPHRQHGARPAWIRPLRRAQRSLGASAKLIGSTMRAVERYQRCAAERPVRTTIQLYRVSERLSAASTHLQWALHQLGAVNECIALDPESAVHVPELLFKVTGLWARITLWLKQASDDVFAIQENVLDGLESGALVPERPAERRPRILVTPKPAPVRAFLRVRQPRVIQRISPLLRRRRRTRRPAALRVPRRNVQGRAPPFSPVSLV
jgi:hypothetical protein